MAKLEDPKDPAKSDSPKKQGLLRREFVKLVGGTGVAATAQVLAGHKLAAAATTVPNAVLGSGKVVGPGPVAMSLGINGQEKNVSVEPGVSWLESHRNPTIEDVKQALGGNLCRCGTYMGVRDAVVEAAASMKGGRA